MGLLDDNYYDNLLKQKQSQATAPQTSQPAAPDNRPVLQKVEDNLIKPLDRVSTPAAAKPDLTPEQTAVNAAKTGTGHYIGREIGSTLGLEFPDEQTWDGMSVGNKAGYTTFEGLKALTKMVIRLPRQIVKAPVKVVYNIVKPWSDLAQGKPTDYAHEAESKGLNIPWVGNVSSYFKDFKDARDAGHGPMLATLSTSANALADVTMAASLVEAVNGAVRPRAKLTPGEQAVNTEPIRQVMGESQGRPKMMTKPEGSPNEYYSLPKTVAKKYGGGSNDTFLKISPANVVGDSHSVEISVVKLRSGAFKEGVDYVKGKLGFGEKTTAGDFGPEVKMEGQVVPTGGKITTVRPPTPEPTVAPAPMDIAPPNFNLEKKFANSTPEETIGAFTKDIKNYQNTGISHEGDIQPVNASLSRLEEFSKLPAIAEKTKADIGSAIANKELPVNPDGTITVYRAGNVPTNGRLTSVGYTEDAVKRFVEENLKDKNTPITKMTIKPDQIKVFVGGGEKELLISSGDLAPAAAVPKKGYDPLASILPKPLKGFENKSITTGQLDHLDQLSSVNDIHPNVVQKVIENVTGKSVVGELTQGEYVKVSQVLATMGDSGKFLGDVNPFINPGAQYLSPTRRFFRNVEETHGYPVYSDAYVPMEDAAQLERVFVDKHDSNLNDIFSKDLSNDYTKSGFAEERRLVKAYIEGDTGAVLKNEKLTPEVKADLVKISDQLKKFYDETGPALGIDSKFFIQNYQPHIQNIGGIYQLYKEGAEIPKALDFFAEHKRAGAITAQVDDALALAQIYTRAGAKKLFTNPVLERVMGMYDGLPKTLQGSVKAYIQEKMGYAGRIEQALNDMVPAINRKLGLDLPPDLARKTTQMIMDTTYAGALGARPDAVIRNSFQAPLIVYPRLGAKFYAQATAKAVTPAGMAELSEKGFLVKLGVPYGEELTKDATNLGKLGNAYRKFTQGSLKGYEYSDAFTRGTAYFQFKMQWEDALSRYNSGKLDYAGFEKEMGMGKFSPVDQNIIRQKLIAGDQEGAFMHGVRDIIDETNFPYRTGASPRGMFGLGGKILSQFSQWPVEYAHTIGSWVRTGQWDNLIRFYAAAATTKRTLEDTFGFNIRKWVGADPLNLSVPPFVKMFSELSSLINSHLQNDHKGINDAQDQILKEVKALGVPLGVQTQRVNNFWRDISMSKKEKLPQGTYGIYDAHGKLTTTTDFANLFWGTLLGFPTKDNVERNDLQTDMTNAKYDYSQAKQDVLGLYRQEKYDEANQIIQDKGIVITPADFDAYYIPLTQRTYQSLPASLKPQFAPRVYQNK